jgi:hypothetical protein
MCLCEKVLECEGYDGLLWGVVIVDGDIMKIILNDFINSFEGFMHSFLK